VARKKVRTTSMSGKCIYPRKKKRKKKRNRKMEAHGYTRGNL
jgi:hypothetical protein